MLSAESARKENQQNHFELLNICLINQEKQSLLFLNFQTDDEKNKYKHTTET